MTRIRLLLLALIALCSVSGWTQEPAVNTPSPPKDIASPPKDQAKCYTAWDDLYFYAAFKVDCPDVRGTHAAPNAAVDGDDSIEVYIQTNAKRSAEIQPNCFSMAISAAGGAQFSTGNEKGALEPATVWTFKYGVTVQGTVNNDGDVDQSYNVEMAIPWELMKIKPPQLGDMMGINFIVRRYGAKPDDLVSLSPNVKTESDVLIPTKWMSLVCASSYTFAAIAPGDDKLVSPKTLLRPPLVNGVVDEREWSKNSLVALDLPMPPGFVYEAKFPSQKLAFTHYFYWYQADPRKGPITHVANAEGRFDLQDFPIKNPGPWFSTDRVQWHKEQLSDMVAAGIDVALPIYWGDKVNRREWSAKGLDCMISAIQELKAEGKPYPLVGMFFDTTAMQLAYGEKPDLKQEEAKRTFYGMIKDFFDRVPVEFRAFGQAGKPNLGKPGPVVFLYTTGFLADLDESFVSYCNERFERDFGSPLIWVGAEDFRAKSAVLDAYSSYGAGLGPISLAGGRIKVASVGAGFDDSAVNRAARIRPRMAGETYDKDWTAMLAKAPQWMVCDGWNELHEGSDLCATREYGRKYIDATKAYLQRFVSGKDFDAQFLRCDVPPVIPAKQIAQAEVTVRNVGNLPWRASEGFSLAYRWYKAGRYLGESRNKRSLERDVAPGETITVTIGLATVVERGQPLAEGDCEVRFEIVRMSDSKWFSAMGGQVLIVPVTIGKADEWLAHYVSCSAPVMMASGPNYQARVRVRNDGTSPWKKGVAKLGCKLFRVSNYIHGGAEDSATEVTIDPVRTVLAKDCRPGDIAEIDLALTLTEPKGKKLPAWSPDQPWSYQLRFDIFNGQKWLSELGVRPLARIVDVFDTDCCARIVDSSVPGKLTAGQTFDAKVVVRNAGAVPWPKKRTKIGYHWYHLDGSQMQWDCPTTPVSGEVKPGWPVVTTAKVKAPDYDGRYVLAWDVMVDDTWLSTQPLTRGGDLLPVFVEVTGGKLAFVDLAGVCDVSATSPDTNRTLGDFDGKGNSFPAEFMPPDVGPVDNASRVYPAAYKYDRTDKPEGRISFVYPDKLAAPKTAVACAGQKIGVEHGQYARLHVLGSSSKGNASGELTLGYADGASNQLLAMSDWTGGPKLGEAIGYVTRHLHTHGGDEPNKAGYLYHYSVPLDSSKTLASLTLPKNADMKIVAITLERAGMPPAPAAAK